MDVADVLLDHEATPVGTSASCPEIPAPRPPRVVVGVDTSLGVLAAVSWAGSEAAATGAALHLVHASSTTHVRTTEGVASATSRGWRRRALGAAAAIAPDAAITVAQVEGPPARGLAALSEDCDRLVVGGRSRRDGADPSGDRTVARLLDDARCPVVVVPPCRTGAWASTPSPRPVLATLRGTDDDQLTLEFAGEAARQRGVALVAAISASAVRHGSALAHARRAGAQWSEVTDDLAVGLRRLGQHAQLLVVGVADPDTGWTDDELSGLLRYPPCAAVVVPARRGRLRGVPLQDPHPEGQEPL